MIFNTAYLSRLSCNFFIYVLESLSISLDISTICRYTYISANVYYPVSWCAQFTTGGRVEDMSSVVVKEGESLDSALRRFKRNCAKAGIQQEIRKREHYEKPSVKRKKKSEAARKRKYN